MSTPTVPIVQHLTDADREAGLALINRCMCQFADEMHAACDEVLAHESERLESLAGSPVVRTMRQIVDAELAARQEAGEE